MTGVVDNAQRLQALDPLQSFCVTAPAGSGKTELLIQRFLTMLARVEKPEEVLAITFTRKAAAEMRARILSALEAAADPEPSDPHKAHTWRLARSAMQISEDNDWRLLETPSQLNIRTIDSWNAYLTRQMPTLSQFGASANPTDNAQPYYQAAIRALLEDFEAGGRASEDLAKALLHFDNNWDQMEGLLCRMLAQREQWLKHLGSGADVEGIESILSADISTLVEDYLLHVSRQLGSFSHTILDLLQVSQRQLNEPITEEFPGTGSDQIESWLRIVKLLLTAKGTWKKRISKNDGFPPEEKEAKAQLASLIDELKQNTELEQHLQLIRYLPIPGQQPDDWEVLMSLARLLPLAAAQLAVVFEQQSVVDHAQIAIAANRALGSDDQFTDLASKLDYRLRHILLDEFQDTSAAQFLMLEKMVRNWREDNELDPENPKTLFVVGDGMQSIYGFRDADVSLFVQLRQDGIAGIEPQCLELQTNFRSDRGLVDWVSENFVDVFPSRDDIQLGAVAFSPSQGFREATESQPVSMLAFQGDSPDVRWAEAMALADVIEAGMDDPECDSIAVLVRARSQLSHLIPVLKERDIPWQAQQIDALEKSPAIVDLLNLCRALHNHADDAAWLALLRAPWCGITLAQMWELLREREGSSVYSMLHGDRGVTVVPEFQRSIRSIEDLRDLLPLRVWIEEAWLRLGGPAAARNEQHLADALDFFDLLEELDALGEVFNLDLLEQKVARLYSSPASGECKLKLMTLHKSKGLEFDWVIMPGLANRPAGDQRDILMWRQFVTSERQRGLLLAVDDRGPADSNSLYSWLRQQQKMRRDLEVSRLMYVGCTRAVNRLYLSASLGSDKEGQIKPPVKGTLLEKIWPVFEIAATVEEVHAGEDGQAMSPLKLRRLVQLPYSPAPTPQTDDRKENIPELTPYNMPAVAGDLIHLCLERLAGLTDSELREFDMTGWQAWWQRYLSRNLFDVTEQRQAQLRVEQAVANILQDKRGQWLLSSDREEATSELRVSRIAEDGRLREMIIDRTFVEDGIRWIVDYKSAVPAEGENLDDFLRYQENQYKGQLLSYRDAMLGMDQRTTRLALYFTALPLWHECSYN
jgi:ATP-dependent helicase/nuclease subunit A